MSLVDEAFPLLPSLKSFSKETLRLLSEYYDVLVAENNIQNLTRLVSTQDFISGHLQDCVEVLPFLDKYQSIMDLGSGAGVPGLICAILRPETRFILAESEKNKADFLERTISELGLQNVESFYGRGEDYLKDRSVDAVISRAVGDVGKIYGWISRCSTWNTLILFKGPSGPKSGQSSKKKRKERFHKNKNTPTPRLVQKIKQNSLLY
jgi:16S rRNA (guanine527-N7)-methyltransferase